MAYPKIGHWRNRPADAGTWRQKFDLAEAEFGVFQGHWSNYKGAGAAGTLNTAEQQAIADGKKLHIYWKPQSTTWAQVASGARDSVIDAAALSFKAQAPTNIWLTIHHEPEDNVNNTAGSGMTQTDYRNMWSQVRSRFDLASVTNISWVWVFQTHLSHPELLPGLWPGNSLVDIVAPQPYINCGTAAGTLAQKWLDCLDWLQNNRDSTHAWSYTDKQVAMTEWGADLGGNLTACSSGGDRGTTTHRKDAIDGITAILSQLESRNVIEIRYFDAGSDYLEDRPSADAEAYAGLKAASEANQNGGGGGGTGVITERTLATNTAATGASSATTLSVTPTGMQQNDWLIFNVVSVGGAATHSVTAGGASRIHSDFEQANTTVLSTWKKKCGAGEAGPYTFSVGASTRRIAVAVRAYTGGDPTDIVAVVGSINGATAQSFAIPGVTPTGTNQWHILFEGSNSAAGASVNFGQPASYTEDHDFASTHATNANACLGFAHRELPSASATGDQTFTITGGVNRGLVGASIVLIPEAAAPSITNAPAGLAIVATVANDAAASGGSISVSADVATVTATANNQNVIAGTFVNAPADIATVNVSAIQPVFPAVSNIVPTVEIAFTESPLTWTDVSSYVEMHMGPLTIQHGRPDEFSDVQPGTLSLQLNNSDGRFTPGLATSPYYPNVKVGRQIRVTVTYNGITYKRFHGYINAWPTRWTVTGTPEYAPIEITATDRFKRLGTLGELRSVLEEEVLRDVVQNGSYSAVYYPLSEPDGSTTIASITKHIEATGFIVQNGSGGDLDFGRGTGPGTDEISAPIFTPVDTSNGKYLRADLLGIIGHPTDGVTLEAWFRAERGTINRSIAILAGYENGDLTYLQLSIGADGKLHGVRIKDGVFLYNIISSTIVNDGSTHHAVVSESDEASIGIGHLYLDNVLQGQVGYGLHSLPTYIRLRIGGDSFGPDLFSGTISHVAAYSTALSATRISDHYKAGKNGISGERTDQRIARIADWIGIVSADRALDVGQTTVGWQGTSGAQPVDAMRQAERTEAGVLFISADNKLTFHSRSRRYNLTFSVTLNAQQAAQLGTELEFPGDDFGVQNDVTVTRERGSPARAVNQSSIDTYGFYRNQIESIAELDTQMQSTANWYAASYGEPKTRVTNVVIDLLALDVQNPSLAASILNSEISAKIRLSNLPSQAPASTLDVFIEGWIETIEPAKWTLELNCSPADVSTVWALGVSGFSELGLTTRIAF